MEKEKIEKVKIHFAKFFNLQNDHAAKEQNM